MGIHMVKGKTIRGEHLQHQCKLVVLHSLCIPAVHSLLQDAAFLAVAWYLCRFENAVVLIQSDFASLPTNALREAHC